MLSVMVIQARLFYFYVIQATEFLGIPWRWWVLVFVHRTSQMLMQISFWSIISYCGQMELVIQEFWLKTYHANLPPSIYCLFWSPRHICRSPLNKWHRKLHLECVIVRLCWGGPAPQIHRLAQWTSIHFKIPLSSFYIKKNNYSLRSLSSQLIRTRVSLTSSIKGLNA